MITLVYIVLSIHLSYYIFLFSRLIWHEDQSESSLEPVSIVVCFKNEKGKIDQIISKLSDQAADDVILMDDYSSDGTYEQLLKYQSVVIRVHKVSQDLPGKKYASSEGTALANNNRILYTDADCQPASEDWASLMSQQPKPIVLGYGPMNKSKQLVSIFSAYETFLAAIQYLSYAKAGIPYMGVGRNMLIDRKLVQKANISGKHLASGDDDLTINAIADSNNTAITLNPRTFVYSDAKTSWSTFISQKARHLTTSVYYKPLHQALLALFSATQIIFYLLIVFGLIFGTISMKSALIFLVIKWGIQILVNYPISKRLKEEHLLKYLPIMDIFIFIYYLAMPVVMLVTKKENNWT